MNLEITNKITAKYEAIKAARIRSNEEDREILINEVKSSFSVDAYNLHKEAEVNPKYRLDLLSSDNDDYQILLKVCQSDSDMNGVGCIYKVTECVSLEKRKNKSENRMLLLHGTKGCNVKSILKEGINQSESGAYGRGIYMTDDFNLACVYGESEARKNCELKTFNFVFVFEVRHSDSLVKFQPKNCEKNLLDENIFSKVLHVKEKINNKDALDSEGRCLVNGTFQNSDMSSNANEFVGSEEIVSPAYLIIYEDDLNSEEKEVPSMNSLTLNSFNDYNEKHKYFLSKENEKIDSQHKRDIQNIVKRIDELKQNEIEEALSNSIF